MVLVLGGAAAIALRGKINIKKKIRERWGDIEYSRDADRGGKHATSETRR